MPHIIIDVITYPWPVSLAVNNKVSDVVTVKMTVKRFRFLLNHINVFCLFDSCSVKVKEMIVLGFFFHKWSYHFHLSNDVHVVSWRFWHYFVGNTYKAVNSCDNPYNHAWFPCYGTLQWRHNERDGVSNHRCLDCLLDRLFSPRSRKTSKPRVTGLCEGNPPVTGGSHTQRSSNADNSSIWRRHHATIPEWFRMLLPIPQSKTHIQLIVNITLTGWYLLTSLAPPRNGLPFSKNIFLNIFLKEILYILIQIYVDKRRSREPVMAHVSDAHIPFINLCVITTRSAQTKATLLISHPNDPFVGFLPKCWYFINVRALQNWDFMFLFH